MADPSLQEAHKTIIDGLDLAHLAGHLTSLGAVAMVFLGALPALAALGAVIWYCIAIYETKTFQAWRARARARKRLAKMVLARKNQAIRRKTKARNIRNA
jgi:uncharacterized membrane protein YphA (DoxX/SURF4 family)